MTRATLGCACLTLATSLAVYDWRVRRHRGWIRGAIAGVIVGLAVSWPGRAGRENQEQSK